MGCHENKMYYELYADSLFFINFIMNLYLLYLTNISTGRTATRKGIILGALTGAVCFLIPFFICAYISEPANHILMSCILFIPFAAISIAFMIRISFGPVSVKGFIRLAEALVKYGFLLGGSVVFILRLLRYCGDGFEGMLSVAVTGTIVTFVLARTASKKKSCVCRAMLKKNDKCMEVYALIDSGNTLTEPISGKPVSVLNETFVSSLWETDETFRVIPYRSVGKTNGILKGYLLDELEIEHEGIRSCNRNVWVAAGNREIFPQRGRDGRISLILNPELIER
jgi:sigma-E processing peptidase SpoIIGA